MRIQHSTWMKTWRMGGSRASAVPHTPTHELLASILFSVPMLVAWCDRENQRFRYLAFSFEYTRSGFRLLPTYTQRKTWSQGYRIVL